MFRKWLVVFLLLISTSIFASSFVIRNIQFQGLQRVSQAAVMHAMPVHVGQTYIDADGNRIIAHLYKTGFFENVQLSREGNTLVVEVTERPTIDSIYISGNKAITTSELKPVLKKLGIVVGNTYEPSELHSIVMGLQQQYLLLGHPGAIITPDVENLPRNRVAIHISIQEGKAIIVRGISFSGNHAFSAGKLRDQFKLTTPSIFTWFNHHDRFSNMQLDEDLQNLQNFYFDHGYLDFHVVSHNVTQLQNDKGVMIHVNVTEGSVYRVSGYAVSNHRVPARFMPKINRILSTIKRGEIFSRAQILSVNKQIGDYLANRGYAFSDINPVPTLHHSTHQVFIHYQIEGNHRVYVRHVHIIGNTRTSGLVIRTQLRQMEGSLYSKHNIKESKRRIENLGYLNHITVETVPVPNKPNQVDLNYHVHEQNAGRASVNAGYSDVEGFLYGASVSEPNFMGSGKYVSVGFTRSEFTSNYNIAYNNPFYTANGISRGFNLYYSHTTPAEVNLEPYTMDDYGASMTYGIPLSEYDQLSAGVGYDHIAISNISPSLVSPSITQFISNKNPPYNEFKLLTGISHSTLNRLIFPTSGNAQSLSLTVAIPKISSFGYYVVEYDGSVYYPMGFGFVLEPHATVGYGDGYSGIRQLPFFANFYAGGLQTLPGYTGNTLGPKNPQNTDEALGGNVETLGGLNFILPDFISDKVRTAFVLDAGNIFQTDRTPGISYEAIRLDNLRVVVGIMLSWRTPIAPLDFGLAFPLNKKSGDQLSPFGFSFGTTF